MSSLGAAICSGVASIRSGMGRVGRPRFRFGLGIVALLFPNTYQK